MDPLTQGALGAALATAGGQRRSRAHLSALASTDALAPIGALALTGVIAGLAPDLDVLIQSDSDPLLFLKYHRQFTHSLLFIPVGALIVALTLHGLASQLPPYRWLALSFKARYLAATLGWGSHGLLDACTSYGTQLLWPFADTRIAWNLISIIDPLFTLPLVALVGLAIGTDRAGPARAALCVGALYLGLGAVQQQRADTLSRALANERGHNADLMLVKPGFGNLLLWKAIYRAEDQFWVDGLRLGLAAKRCGGEQIPVLDTARDLPGLAAHGSAKRALTQFRWFSGGYLARDPELRSDDSVRVIDVRYSMLPNRIDPLWGIVLPSRRADSQEVRWWSDRRASPTQREALWALLSGSACSPSEE